MLSYTLLDSARIASLQHFQKASTEPLALGFQNKKVRIQSTLDTDLIGKMQND